MSIIHLTNPSIGEKAYNINCKTINNVCSIDLASSPFIATPPTPLKKYVQGYIYAGNTQYGGSAPQSAKFYAYFGGGILGVTRVKIISQNIASPVEYFNTVIPVDGTGLIALDMSPAVALPNSLTPLFVTIESDATSNSTFYPLSIVLNF